MVNIRLINTSTLKLEEFPDSRTPSYAILSHRGGEEEITFEDLCSSRDVSGKKGFAKTKGFCCVARSEAYDYTWIDTCCINKESSTELGTAINSMYRWYADARLCIVYLADVGLGGRSMKESEWFDRGWTLQELVAPRNLTFYDRHWLSLGTKSDHLTLLHEITRIPRKVLSHASSTNRYSVAQRMSWAAKRITERVEDKAFSLMGLFDVNMAMIYGEREQAFIRLQEHILQHLADQSILAWGMDRDNHPDGFSGLLALSPSSFRRCSEIVPTRDSKSFGLLNLGLSISLPTYPYSMETDLAFLECTDQGQLDSRYAIFLTRLSKKDQYARVMSVDDRSRRIYRDVPGLPQPGMIVHQIYVPQLPTEAPSNKVHGFWLRSLEPPGLPSCQTKIISMAQTAEADRILLAQEEVGFAGIVSIKPVEKRPRDWTGLRWISLGFDEEFNPLIMLADDDPKTRKTAEVKPNAETFDSAAGSGPESAAQTDLFANDEWLTLRSDSVPPREWRRWAAAFYILKVDRRSGGTYNFDYLSLRIDVRLLPDQNLRYESESRPSGNRSVWVVDVTDLGQDSGPFESHWYSCWCCSESEAFRRIAPFRDGFGRPTTYGGLFAATPPLLTNTRAMPS